MKWLWSSSLNYDNFCTKSGTGNKIKYCRFPKNIETQQENAKENTEKATEINWNKGHICSEHWSERTS